MSAIISPHTHPTPAPGNSRQARLCNLEQSTSAHIIGAKTFSVEIVNDHGVSLKSPSLWTLETREAAHDVADVLTYAISDSGELLIAIVTSFRPTTLIGTEPTIAEKGFTSNAFLESQPGSYVELRPGQGSASLLETAQNVQIKKLGLAGDGKIEILPASSFPNPKDSSEYVIQLAAKVSVPSELSREIEGSGLSAGRKVEFIPAQEVIDRYLLGRIKDPRLLQGTLALAERLGTKLDIPAIDTGSEAPVLSSAIPQHLSVQSTIDFTRSRPSIGGQAVRLKITESSEQSTGYLTAVSGVSELDEKGNSEKIPFSALIQPNLRHTHCLCFTKNEKGQILVLVNKGLRPALALRKNTMHPIGTELPDWSIEGISFPSDHTFTADSPSRIADKLQSIGIKAAQVNQVSEEEFPSPGFSPCSVSRNIVRVNAVDSTQLEFALSDSLVQPEFAWIELSSLISSINLGEIHDLNLITSARWLQNSLKYERNRLNLWTPSERAQLSEIAIQGSPLLKLINSTPEGRELHQKLYSVPIYRQLLQFGESELGIKPREFSHHEEQIFFDAGFAIFAMPETKNGAAFIIQLLHDLRHYAIGSMIPFFSDKNKQIIYDANGQPKPQLESEYGEAYRENEAEAGFFSHYDLPRLIGLEDAKIVLGFQPLSKVFDDLGITDREEARQAFRMIEFDRLIPEKILSAPAYQNPEIRTAILQLLKLARIFDCHMEQLYPHWLKYPKVAQAALDFSETIVTTLSDHLNSFRHSWDKTLENPEGFNPFKTHIAQFINTEIRMPALRLAYVHELLTEQSKHDESGDTKISDTLAQIDLQLANLLANYKKFITARNNCNSLDYTIENLATLRMLNRFQATQTSAIDALYSRALSHLPSDLQASLVGRELPFFPRLEFGQDPEILAYAEERERLSLANAGL